MSWLSGAQWRYCAKVGIATALGYALTQGGQNQYAIYSAFTAALVVGTSVGEDLATSANRVKGTLAGMIAGMVTAFLAGPSFLTLGASAALTALIALAFGWGIPVARIGVTVCIITLAWHGADALQYDLFRALNTLIGILAGLAVTFFIWPVRSPAELERTMRGVVTGSRDLLDALVRGEQNLLPLTGKLHDSVAALVKAIRDAQREQRAGYPPPSSICVCSRCSGLGWTCFRRRSASLRRTHSRRWRAGSTSWRSRDAYRFRSFEACVRPP